MSRRSRSACLSIATILVCVVGLSPRIDGQTSSSIELVSVTPGGAPAGGGEVFSEPALYGQGGSKISADNRYVVFASTSDQLVAGDLNGREDIFVRDRQTGTTTLVSVATGGAQANNHSGVPAISANGRFVAFVSNADNLVPGDTNVWPDVFVRDLQLGVTTRASVATGGGQANFGGLRPAISADGRYVVFESESQNLAPGDPDGFNSDIYLRDTVAGLTTRVSVRPDGSDIVGSAASEATISNNGRRIAFAVRNDFLGGPDPHVPPNFAHGIYVRDLDTNQTILVSARPDGTPSELLTSLDPVISGNGRYVVFADWEDLDPNFPDSADEGDGPYADVFVRDLQTSTTRRASLPFPGGPVEESGGRGTISADGRYVAYGGDRLRDLVAGTTTLIRGPGQVEPNASIDFSAISSDGQLVWFQTTAGNLVANDLNGEPDVFLFRSGPSADVSLTLSASPTQPAPNSDVVLTVTANNAGPDGASGVAVRVTLPTGVGFVSSTGPGSYDAGSGVWTAGAIGSASSAALQITAHFTASAAVTVTAEVSAASPTDPDSTPDNHNPAEDDQASVQLAPGLADLSLTLTANTLQPPVNSNVTLTTIVSNAGPGPTNGVAVRLPIAPGLTFVSANPAAAFDAAPGVWSVGAVNPGIPRTLSVIARVTASTAIDVTAQVSASAQPDPDSTPNNNVPSEDDHQTVRLTPVDTGIVVNDSGTAINGNDGWCTLIEAIVAANTDSPSGNAVGECAGGNGADIIRLRALNPPYVMSAAHNLTFGANGLPAITSDITIDGGNAVIARSFTGGTPAFRLFYVAAAGRLTLDHTILANGFATSAVPSSWDQTGGGVLSHGALVLNATIVTGNNALCFGGGVASGFGSVVVQNGSSIQHNISASCSGGGLYLGSGASLTVTESSIRANSAPVGEGGGVVLAGANATFVNSAIEDNGARVNGGGLLSQTIQATTSLVFDNTVVARNTAAIGNGGGLVLQGGAISLRNNTRILSNTAALAGGGIFVRAGGACCAATTLQITGGSITGNVANGPWATDGGGGGLASVDLHAGSSVTLTSVLVSGNQAPFGDGGGIYNRGAMHLVGGELRTNSAQSGGGFANGTSNVTTGAAILDNVTIVDNVATSLGGGIFASTLAASAPFGSVAVNGGAIRTNRAQNGGGVFNRGASTVTVTGGAAISANSATVQAGGIGNEGTLVLSGSTVALNTAPFVAGLFSAGGTSINGSTFSGNVAERVGAIRVFDGTTTTIVNSTISSNAATADGAGGVDVSGTLHLRSSTVTANVGNNGGLANAGVATIVDTILAGNRRPAGAVAECVSFPGALFSQGFNVLGADPGCPLSTSVEGVSTSHLVDAATVASTVLATLADNGGPTQTHALRPGSLAIDGGSTTCPAVDQRGEARPVDGDGDGSARCDVGALESQSALPSPLPALTAMPSFAAAGSPDSFLQITGAGFVAGSVVLWNGGPRTTYVNSTTRLTVFIPAADFVSADDLRMVTVVVRNPDGGVSNALVLPIVSTRVSAAQSTFVPPGATGAAATLPTLAGRTGVSASLHNNGGATTPAVVTVATYSALPVSGTPLWAGGFFDVHVTGADASDAVDVAFYYSSTLTPAQESSLFLQYWTGASWVPVTGAGGALPIKDTTDNLDGTVSGGRVTVTLDGTSIPSILELSGTVFALAESGADVTPPTTVATTDVTAGPAGWFSDAVYVTLTASDGSGSVERTELELDGAGWRTYTAPFKVREEGVHTLRFRSRDAAGNLEPERTLVLRIDYTPPVLVLRVRPQTLWPADGRMVDVSVDVTTSDELSGADGVILKSIESTADGRREGGPDIDGWAPGTADVTGRLKAERGPGDAVRIYTLTYQAYDKAGNRTRRAIEVRVSQ
jgi:uncharacterized repeat protein (TIGR01451 family)